MLCWAIQKNLLHENDKNEIYQAFDDLKHKYYKFDAIPFSDDIPDFPDQNIIFYGSTNVINSIYKSNRYNPGVFFNEKTFDYRMWYDQYHILNSDCKFVKLKNILEHNFIDDHLFIRPVLDLKEFAGQVIHVQNFTTWKDSLYGDKNQLLNCQCVISKPFGIEKEWRLFIVDKKVVGSSQYRDKRGLKLISGAPQDVINFAEEQCKIFIPHDIFVLDICQSGGNLYVLEAGCFNSAGFYKSHLRTIFQSIYNFVLKKEKL